MAIVAHVVERLVDPGDFLVDGIVGVVIAIDDAVDTTDALVQARARTVINAVLGAGKLPVGYFNANRLASTYDDAEGVDITVFGGERVHHAIAE
jgi:hypothetical protein